METILEVKYPPITTYTNYAVSLSILSLHDEYLPWFFINFSQMYTTGEGINFYNFLNETYECPWLNVQKMDNSLIKHNMNNIIEFFEYCINSGWYIVATINRNEISSYGSKKKKNPEHPMMIYGYNNITKQFNIADFFKDGVYSFSTASYDEVNAAFNNVDDTNYWLKGVTLLQFNKNGLYTFNLRNFKEVLEDYSLSKDTSSKYHKHTDYITNFGIDAVYNRLKYELSLMISDNSEEYDTRGFAIICDQKRVLRMAFDYLINNNFLNKELIDGFKKVEDGVQILRNKVLKFKVSGKKTNISQGIELIDTIVEEEKTILQRVVKIL